MKRMDSLTRVAAIVAILCAACPAAVSAERLPATPVSQGVAAMQTAASQGKYLFVYFWKQNDQQTQSMYGVFQGATGKMARAADAVRVNITDPKERPIVDQFDVSRAPMPLVLAVAPNGAVTKGIPISFTEKQLQEALVSRGTAACLKPLQDRKLVLLCLQDRSMPSEFQGVRDFAADPRFASSAQIVTIDSTDQSEAGFLRSLKVDPRRDSGAAILLAPPGQPVAKFASTVTKEQIVARVTASSSGCCPGGSCGPGGQCGPGQQCEPGQQCGPNGCGPR